MEQCSLRVEVERATERLVEDGDLKIEGGIKSCDLVHGMAICH